MPQTKTKVEDIRNRIFSATIYLSAAISLLLLIWIVGGLAQGGFSQINIEFLTTSLTDSGRQGGILPVLVSTFWILFLTGGIAFPVAMLVAVCLADAKRERSRLARWIVGCLCVLGAVPSIVFGLFGNAFFCVALGMGYSILAGALTLSCMVLPLAILTSTEALMSVPTADRLGGFALGFSRTTVLFRIELPIAAPGLATGFVLSIGRALAETAALLFTAGYVARMPESVMDSGRAVSVHVFDLAMNVPGGNDRALATGLILIALLILINLSAAALMSLSQSYFLDRSLKGNFCD